MTSLQGRSQEILLRRQTGLRTTLTANLTPNCFRGGKAILKIAVPLEVIPRSTRFNVRTLHSLAFNNDKASAALNAITYCTG